MKRVPDQRLEELDVSLGDEVVCRSDGCLPNVCSDGLYTFLQAHTLSPEGIRDRLLARRAEG